MIGAVTSWVLGVLVIGFSGPAMADVPKQERSAIDRIIGGKGAYAADDGVYKVILPREAATIVQDYQTLSPNFGLNSWVAFTSAAHSDAILTGQFLLLDSEVDSALSAVLNAGLEVNGLAASSLFDGPRLHILDVTGHGSFRSLAVAFRKGLDEISHVQRTMASGAAKFARPTTPLESSIVSEPIDAILSMKGSLIAGVYKAAIGKRALLDGELIGREMGMTTWVCFAGSNVRTFAYGEFVETSDDLQKVLKALRLKGISIELIRNHTIGEHPQVVFIRFWSQGTALELAKAVRYVLDVEVGAASAPGVLDAHRIASLPFSGRVGMISLDSGHSGACATGCGGTISEDLPDMEQPPAKPAAR
jgi:hypothetical protein